MNILFISLGCDKNLVDSEKMLGLLAKKGYEITDTEDQADIIVVNTCCFIHDAKEESIQTILEMAEHRKNGRCKALVVTGCLAQRYQEEITKEIQEVDAVLGTAAFDEIVDVVEEVLKGQKCLMFEDIDRLALPEVHRIVTECYEKAKAIIIRYRAVLDECAGQLIKKEKLTRSEFEKIFNDVEGSGENE